MSCHVLHGYDLISKEKITKQKKKFYFNFVSTFTTHKIFHLGSQLVPRRTWWIIQRGRKLKFESITFFGVKKIEPSN